MYLIFLVLVAALAVFLGVLFKNKILKNYPEEDRKSQEIISMVLFVVGAVIVYSAVFIGINTNSAIKKYSVVLEEYVYENHSDIEIVANGINMTDVSNNIEKLNTAVAELKTAFWPEAQNLGIPKFVFDMAADYITRQIQLRLTAVNAAGKVGNIFADSENMLTVKSLLNGLRIGVMKVINVIILIVVCVVVLAVGIYILVTMSAISSAKKRQNAGENTSYIPNISG